MICSKCGTKIEEYETSERCSACGKVIHARCGKVKRQYTSRFYEWLTGKSYIDRYYCNGCK